MKRIMIIALAVSMTLMSCNGQTKEANKQNKDISPQTNIKVNKQYDKNGNIIRYDSTYSSYYSNIKGDTSLKDSIFKISRTGLIRVFFSNQPFFKNFFFEDTLLKYDFYKKDFFIIVSGTIWNKWIAFSEAWMK